MTRNTFSEQALKKAAGSVRSYMIRSLPEEAEGQFSCEFLSNIEELRILRKRHEKQRQFKKRFTAAIVALISIIAMLLTFNKDVRAAVFSWFKEIFDTRTIYWFNVNNPDGLPAYEIFDLPENFIRISDKSLTHSRTMLYQNSENMDDLLSFEYAVLQEDSPLSVSFPSAGFSVTKVIVAGNMGDLYISNTPNESHALVWVDESDGVVFTITSFLEPEDMLHIAQSVKLVK